MIVEKKKRYFRRYSLHWKGLGKGSAPLALYLDAQPNSIVAALRRAIKLGNASAMEGKDSIDLLKANYYEDRGLVVLLFHRTSPDASDPAYRKRTGGAVAVRQSVKLEDEDQAYSCHLVIKAVERDEGGYLCVLEEIPGLSATTVFGIIKRVLNEFRYPYTYKKKELETTTQLKVFGVKSENLDSALKKKSSLNYLILTRTPPPSELDSGGIIEPKSERAKYKIIGDPTTPEWKAKFANYVAGTKGTWDQVAIEVQLEDDRQRTVVIDRDNAAADILFVRSEIFSFKADLPPCSEEVVPRIVNAAEKILAK
ncbi:conserved hypothetical protein [Sphingomonas sp. T1]|uniref:hypothetical protein n=1 Tax=Sphingomonas sp. T1 TaxID=2653172 RepID=UPI0012F0A32A|nr:hypothetical protein [Sphingomonas sp. T1]VXD07760.1 conserved hypothetical protein [Sphingomonas sp. T1]